MNTITKLRQLVKEIDHKSYGSYKLLQGEYDMGEFTLCIDKVQGDPFASPSRIRLLVPNNGKIKEDFFCKEWRKNALEDFLLRLLWKQLGKLDKEARGTSSEKSLGSGKSGLIGICRVGQQMLPRTALLVDKQQFVVRMELGFPAFGRTIAGTQFLELVCERIPFLVRETFFKLEQYRQKMLDQVGLADNQEKIRNELIKRGLVCFVADGSILPRESGVSDRPMKNAVVFSSPAKLQATMQVPYQRGNSELPDWREVSGESEVTRPVTMTGMGIPKGITLIVGGGYHGKSTLLKAVERGVYSHIEGDGREYVITDPSAVKLRSEEGRFIFQEDISRFITNLPSKMDTTCFSTENASGSTSQAANTIEAMAAGSRVFLIDEDTTATNFMVRDERMAKLVSQEHEPIRPFLHQIRPIYEEYGISTILVAGSSGDFFGVADHVVMMDAYEAKDVTEKAKRLVTEYAKEVDGQVQASVEVPERKMEQPARERENKCSYKKYYQEGDERLASLLAYKIQKREIGKLKTHGWDELVLDHSEIDLRYLEQVVDQGQTIAIGYLLQYALGTLADGTMSAVELAKKVYEMIDQKGFLSMIPSSYPTGAPVLPRYYEFLACLLRYRQVALPSRNGGHRDGDGNPASRRGQHGSFARGGKSGGQAGRRR